jgi:signal peptidase II
MLLSGRPSKATMLGCGLILGGAAGNLLDRLSSGEVTDYIHFSFWYIFNAADAAIVVGVGLLLLSALRPEKAGSSLRRPTPKSEDR